jgi:hypothetical protein
MRTLCFMLTLFFGHLILACNHNTEVEMKEVTIVGSVSESVPAPEPPPPSFSCSNPVTLQEWFFKFCDTEKPKKDIINYKLELFDTENCYAIHLIGVKEYETENQDSSGKNDPENSDNYYPLSKNEYKELNWKQTLNKIRSQLNEFVKTENFKNSSLAKAKTITILFDDGDLLRLK